MHEDPLPLDQGSGFTTVNTATAAAVEETKRLLCFDPSHLAEMIASATDAIVNTDGEQHIILFNVAAERMFGRAASEMMGEPVERIILEGLRNGRPMQSIRVAMPSTVIEQTNNLSALTGIRADGAQFPIEASISQIQVEGRSIYTAILRDITERSEANAALRHSEQALADIFATSPVGLLCVTPDGQVDRVNEAELKLLGRTRDEVVGKPVHEFHVHREAIELLLSRLAEGETVKDFHLHTMTNGTLNHLLVDANGVWEHGALVCSRWFIRDITSRIRMEYDILAIAENERQRLGQDMHDDLCQQLVAIEFMVETLAAGLRTEVPDAADRAHHIAFLLRTLTENARHLARGLAPSLPDQPEGLMIALQELAERTTKIFQRDCHFECATPVLSPNYATTIHLFRIAQEAVGNAIKHGHARRIVIRLFVNGKDIVLGIHDDGNGAHPVSLRQGMGLRLMQYRSGVIGGSLVIQRFPGEGTTVVCTVKPPITDVRDPS